MVCGQSVPEEVDSVRRGTRLVISVLSGVAAVIVALAYASSVQQDAAAAQADALARFGGEPVAVCVAVRDIAPGEVLDDENVVAVEWAAGLVPEEPIAELGDAVGRVATSRIPKNAVICSTYLEAHSGGIEVPAGTVAVSVASDPVHAVGGSIAPGDTVDVYVTQDAVADRLMSAQVLDTSAEATGDTGMSWVTLAVEPERVRELLVATSLGQVTLAVPGAYGDASADAPETGDA